MNTKKLHEVEFFSQHVASLAKTVRERRGQPVSHIVDFGSGQNYLGRTLASSPHHKHIIAIERKHQFISGAQGMDIHANLAERKKKTVYVHNRNSSTNGDDCKPEAPSSSESQLATEPHRPPTEISPAAEVSQKDQEDVTMFKMLGEISLEPDELLGSMTRKNSHRPKPEPEIDTGGKISYIEHEITDGLLEPIINHVVQPAPGEGGGSNRRSPEETSVTVHADGRQSSNAQVMVVSLHSCGNLVHHGVRSLILNPSVVAVAMIGCCYNLMTERLGPATYKLPVLRSLHPRLKETGNSYDPHGFPMSQRFETHDTHGVRGLRLNITARMMAVQAPYNWGKEESEGFFTRHFFRALLQRIFVEQGVVPPPGIPKDLYSDDPDQSIGATTALIIGSLRKSAFASFTTYARAAAAKLSRDPQHGAKVEECIGRMTDEELDDYATSHLQARKNLSIVWSLMAFSAQVVEAIIVVDRWQFLREHKSVKECWVEPVFDYALSPRNLAVMGIKK
ncbi:hypothetical protein N7532_000888 [Penicillium argentinense]|uniref:Methyltransferase domain-containing protein n=1 Tax=Penicillium argentinense TaxID=1131581 RepID=A0A9W9KPA5_9EURO|nr:uncharacterized protein N7532_000888 [Penicillium argentinense]KAJ5112843.1 hypothetical protein N7532_000888 [Penicillium argentinense]